MSDLIERHQKHAELGMTYTLSDSRQLSRDTIDRIKAQQRVIDAVKTLPDTLWCMGADAWHCDEPKVTEAYNIAGNLVRDALEAIINKEQKT